MEEEKKTPSIFDYKARVIDDENGINGFVAIMITAILMILFEVFLFRFMGMNDIKNNLSGVKKTMMETVDERMLGNKKYCSYLLSSKNRTKHSDELYNKLCKDKYNTTDLQKEIQNVTEYMSIDDVSDIDELIKFNNINKILNTMTNDTDIIKYSFYDYFRKHPEFVLAYNKTNTDMKEKLNTELFLNGIELVLPFFIILIVARMTSKVKKLCWPNIIANVGLTILGLILFQLMFYFAVTMKYIYEGDKPEEVIKNFMNS